MRLIDADRLKEVIIEGYREVFFGSVLWDILNDMPTAYDIDKVVWNLEGAKFDYNEGHPIRSKALDDAIDIVKQGLKEQNK